MICNTTYPTFEAIPEFARPDFEQQADGSWKMKPDAIPGAAEFFNPSLAANRDRALQQLTATRAERDAANARASQAETSVQQITAGGGRVFSAADAQAFDQYKILGDVPTLTKIKTEGAAALQELALVKGEKGVKEITEKTGLNFEPVRDWLAKPPAGVTYEPFHKEEERDVVEVQNGQNVTVKKKVPVAFLRKIVDNNGVKTQTEVELLTEAKTALPNYAFEAITAKAAEGAGTDTSTQTGGGSGGQQTVQSSVVLPMLGGGSQQTGGGLQQPQNLTPAQTFQAERDKKPNPFAPKT